MEFIIKYWPAFFIALAGLIITFLTFYASKKDTDQKDSIEKIVKNTDTIVANTRNVTSANLLLTQKIDSLTILNNELIIKSKEVIDANHKLSKESVELGKKIDHLTQKIDKDETLRSAILPKTGIWRTEALQWVSPQKIKILLGDKVFDHKEDGMISIGNYTFPTIKIKMSPQNANNYISIAVTDEYQRPIVVMKDNRYTIDNNADDYYAVLQTEEFFQVMSKDGMVLLSIEITKDKNLRIRGVFDQWMIDQALIIGDKEYNLEYKRKDLLTKEAKRLITPFQ